MKADMNCLLVVTAIISATLITAYFSIKYLIKLKRDAKNWLTKYIELEQEHNKLKEDARDYLTREWLGYLKDKNGKYKSELDVEVKFIHRLVVSLGYSDDQYEIRKKLKFKLAGKQYS